MPEIIDVGEGDEYSIVEPGLAGNYRFLRMNGDGWLVLKDLETLDEILISYEQFALMRGLGSATRTKRDGVSTCTEALGPFYLLDPDDPRISKKERARRTAARKKLLKARTLLFALRRYDDTLGVTTFHKKLEPFLDETKKLGEEQFGFVWRISASVFRTALNRFGKPGNRNLGQILGDLGKHKVSRWPDWVDKLKEEMIDLFWSSRLVKASTAKSVFLAKFEKGCEARGLKLLEPPRPTTLQDWLNKSETKERFARKWGSRKAHKRYVGTADSLRATRPLEYVILDQTLTDLWLLIVDAHGNVVAKARAWLVYALDVFSGMALGHFLTFEPPSVYSLMKCIKHTLRPKTELEKRFGPYKGATDGWGKGSTFILDNSGENIGVSLQTVFEGIGIDIVYASLKTPEHKARVERLFGTTNNLWHQLPGGRPGGHDKRNFPEDDAREQAMYTLPQATRLLEEYLVTIYHVEAPRGGIAPAQKWSAGITKHGRPTVDDVNVLDRMIGKYGRAFLTTSGISFKGEQYHDQALTTLLIRDMAILARKREQRGPGQTITIRVNVFCNPLDCSVLNVLNEATGELIQLPNIYPESTRDLSFEHSKQLRLFAEKQKLEFHSDFDRARARAAMFSHLQASIDEGSKPTKKEVRGYYLESMTLAPGAEIQEVVAEPSATGMNGPQILNTAPVTQRRDHGVAPLGPTRGSKKRKGGKSKPDIRSETEVPPVAAIENKTVIQPSNVTDIESYLAQRSLDKSRRW